MSDIAIRIENLSKLYHLGAADQRHDTLRDSVVGLFQRASRSAKSPPASSNDLWALKDVSFEVKRGEVVGIIGRNGAGKSTLLKILSRITEPTSGAAEIHGRVGSLLEVGTGFHPELSGRENIFLNGTILGMRRREISRCFDEIVAFAEIERFLDTPVKRYSSGMYVRLAFAVAAHLEPEILLVDEVLSVGDAAFQKKCLGKMDDVAKAGRTVLFVSHNMNAVQRLCPTSVLLKGGRLSAAGATKRIVDMYLPKSSGAPAGEWIDLTGCSRSGSGKVQFRSIWFTSSNEGHSSDLYPNGPASFFMNIQSDISREIGTLSVIVYDGFGVKLVNADIVGLGKTIQVTAGSNYYCLRMDQLHLKPGNYILGLWMGNYNGEVFDFIPDAFNIEVIEVVSERLGMSTEGYISCDFDIFRVNQANEPVVNPTKLDA